MIFAHTYKQVLDGSKTETRRVWKAGWDLRTSPEGIVRLVGPNWPHTAIYETGKTVAIQTGRGKAAVGRILLCEIRREALQDITLDGLAAEGIKEPTDGPDANEYWREEMQARYARLWDSINQVNGTRWRDNPCVAVFVFSLVNEEI